MFYLFTIFIFSLFGFSQNECDVCGWPYRTGVNSQGKCFLIREGLQSGLEAGCYVWCDAWARQSGVSTPSTPVLTFWHDAGGAICKCQRLERSGEVGYNTRPTAACDWAYSDEVQNYYDSVAVNHRSENITNAIQSVGANGDTSFMAKANAFHNRIFNSGYQYAAFIGCAELGGDATNELGNSLNWYVSKDGESYVYENLPLPPGTTCLDFQSGKLGIGSSLAPVYKWMSSTDTGIRRVNDAIDAVQKAVGSNQASIMDELGKIRSKPVGGGANLDPVFDSLTSFQSSQSQKIKDLDLSLSSAIADLTTNLTKSLNESIDKLKGSLDSSSHGGTGDFSAIREAIDTTNMHLRANIRTTADSLHSVNVSIRKLTDSLVSPGSPFGRMADSMGLVSRRIANIDSQMRYDRAFDRSAESLAYEKATDSLRVPVAERQQVEQGIQQAQGIAITGESNVQSLRSSLTGWQNLPGVCSDAPYWEIDLTSSHLGIIKIDLNAYPWVPKFSRMAMRFIGIMAGLFIVLGALQLLGYSNAKKE